MGVGTKYAAGCAAASTPSHKKHTCLVQHRVGGRPHNPVLYQPNPYDPRRPQAVVMRNNA